MDRTELPEPCACGLDEAVAALLAAAPDAAADARAEVIEAATVRMREMAHRMLFRFPTVRRWNQTDDIVQGAALRLHRALGATTPENSGRFLGLVALQIRRELLDLARSYASPDSFARNHETNAAGVVINKADLIPDEADGGPAALSAWTRFHEVVAALAAEDRELFDLVWFLGLPQERIATSLGCSTRTIRRRWEAIRRTLLDALGNDVPR